jgi:serine/threonine protein kinase
MPTSNPSEADRPPKPESNAARLSSSLVRLLPSEGAGPTASPDDRLTIIGPKVAAFPSPHVVLNAGVRLGHYEVIEAIGSGGMATVLKARDTELGRDVALKILPPEAARDPDAVARFKLEARSAAKLDHEYVARVFSCGEDRGLHFIAFEFVEGVTLRDEIDRLGTVAATDCVRYMSHLAAGLQHAADRGVVHRDVKPSNIIITPDGRAKIIDMGLARQMDLQPVNGGVTQSGVTLGTFDYISPEQALDPRRADVRSDLYSLGCAFYHALTGRPPVPEGTAAKKLQAHQHEAPIDPRELNPAVPDDVAIVLSKLMMKDPAKRYQTPLELIADLTEISATWRLPLEGSAIHPILPHSDRPLPSVLRSADLPRLPLGLAIGLAAMVLAGLIVYGSLGGKPAPYQNNDFASGTTKPAAISEQPPPGQERPPQIVNSGATLETVAELARAFESNSVSVKLVPGRIYDLSTTPGLLFQGKDLLLECVDPMKPATIRIAATPVKKLGGLRDGTLTIAKAESVTFHGVLIEVIENEKPGAEEETKTAPVGVLISDAGKVEFSESRVVLGASANSAFGTGIRLVRTDRSPAMALTVKHCLFDLRRWAALELGEGLTASIRESGFATAETAIRFSEDIEPPDLPVALSLQHCTFLLENRAAAIDIRKGAGGTITSGFCVYGSALGAGSVMMMAESGDRKPTVLRVAEGADSVMYSNEPEMHNAYYRVVAPPGAGEKDAELKQAPWANNPPQGLLLSKDPWKAFKLNPAMLALRVSTPKDVYLLGVKLLPVASSKTGIYEDWPPAGSAVDAPPPGFKVWWPNPPTEKRELLPANGVYASLAEALAAVKRDDVLLIRGEGPFEVPNLPPLGKADLRLTIRPEDDKASIVLVPAEATRADSSLFRLEDGELILERLQFRLRPKPAEAADLRSQAVVSLAGGKRCEFHQCAITLDEQMAEKLAAVSIVDVAGQMRKPDAARRPLVRMENCIIRGKGRAIWAANAIPCDLAMANCIVALSGPVIDLDSPTKAPASGAIIGVNLVHVTALLNEPFFELETVAGNDDKPGFAVPVEVRSEGCLFAAHEPAKPPLVRILQADPAMWDRYFSWQTLGPNAYANWPETAALYELTGEPGSSESKRLDCPAWLAFTKEKADAMGKLKWMRTLPDVNLKPQDFEMAENLWKDDVGAKRGSVAVPSED